MSVRQVKRLLYGLKKQGDKAVVHGLRGRDFEPEDRDEDRAGGGEDPVSGRCTEDSGRHWPRSILRSKHGIEASKETVRQWMMRGKTVARPARARVEQVHVWRPRRSRFGELVQWDTSEHDWLEGRGEKLYLIAMIDDATSRLFARFVRHDSTEENMRLLWSYLEKFGRPLAFYTDKASLFQTARRRKTGRAAGQDGGDATDADRPGLTGTGITWIAAHSPQAKGRVERSFGTAQDRLGERDAGGRGEHDGASQPVSGKRVSSSVEEKLTVAPAPAHDAHRRSERPGLDSDSEPRRTAYRYQRLHLSLSFSHLSDRARSGSPGLRQAECALSSDVPGSIAVRWEGQYLRVSACDPAPTPKTIARKSVSVKSGAGKAHNAGGKSQWMKGYYDTAKSEAGQSHCHLQRNQLTNKEQLGTPGKLRPADFAFISPKPPLESSTTMMHKRKTPESVLEGSLPISTEPAPSPRLWASAWARPLADDITLTRHSSESLQNRTFLLCQG